MSENNAISKSDAPTYTDKVIKLSSPKHVRTPQGAAKYGDPIGSLITKNIKASPLQHHGIISAEGAKEFASAMKSVRSSAQKNDAPAIHRHLVSAAKVLQKYNGDKQTTRYVQFLLRKFFPNLPSPVRHIVHSSPLKKLKRSK